MKKLIPLFVCLLLLAGCDQQSGTSSNNNAGANPPSPPATPSPPPPESVANSTPTDTLSADDLYSQYNANEVAADAKYKGKVVDVYGVIRDIGKDILGSPYVVLGGQGFLDGVQCTFPRADDSPVAHVTKGQFVSIRGRVSGKMGNVLVNECQFDR
jgi:hypothetical protein